jgi:ribosomal protein S10
MSSSGNQNVDIAGSSSRQFEMEEHYRLMVLESQQEDAEYRPSDSESDDDDAGDDDERRVINHETTNSGTGAGGSESTSQANKSVQKKQRPNIVAAKRDTFTLVEPTSGIPKEPLNFTKGYGLQLAAILYDVVNVNEPPKEGPSAHPTNLEAARTVRVPSRVQKPGSQEENCE